MNRLLPLPEAIRRYVAPGMHLHFASSPSRSNAAVRELARAFSKQRPGFVLSTTGFHSSAHTLPLLGLGRRYIACFFGDNYPTPRPIRLYAELSRADLLEHWSLLTYTLALRAGALGHPYAVTTSLGGTDLGAALARRGRLYELADPAGGAEPLRLLAPLVPDVTFMHAVAGTASGRAVFSAPFGEGFDAAHAASQGVIVTVEKLVEERELDGLSSLLPLPPARVLAIAEEPFGAHPQPLYVSAPVGGVSGYSDDFAAYEEWRRLAERPELFAAYERAVLAAPNGREAYVAYVGAERLRSLCPGEARRGSAGPRARTRAPNAPLDASERMILLAARTIARRVREGEHHAILAGIGQAFFAARLALLLARAAADDVELVVETGISGFDPASAHPFLLSAENMASARRLSDVAASLGVVACGRQNRCLAVVGCAEADANGNLNSSVVGGELIVGSGGASDLTAGAREAVVLCKSDRLASRVEFVTSPGDRVRTIVTEDGVLERAGVNAGWELKQHGLGVRSATELSEALPFPVRILADEPAEPPTHAELDALAEILPEPAHSRSAPIARSHA